MSAVSHAISRPIYAAPKGNHIYGQKPLALTIAECRLMSDEWPKPWVL